MLVYYIFFAFSFVSYKYFKECEFTQNKKIYNLIMGCIVFGLFALRDKSLGMYDVEESYIPMFERLSYIGLKDVSSISQNDYLFWLSSKIISLVFNNVKLWIAIMSLPICIAVSKLINNYSKIDWISWILFFSFGYFNYNVTLMKQSVAMALGIFSFLAICEKNNYKRAVIYCLLAIGFHTTGILTALPIVIHFFKPKMNVKKGCFIIGISFVVWIFSRPAVEFMFEKITLFRFQRYYNFVHGFNMTMLLIYIFIFVFCMISRCVIGKKNSDSADSDDYMLWMLALSLPLLGLTSTFSTLFRASLYCSIFSIVCIPNSLIKIEKNDFQRIATILIFALSIYYANVRGLLEVNPYKSWMF